MKSWLWRMCATIVLFTPSLGHAAYLFATSTSPFATLTLDQSNGKISVCRGSFSGGSPAISCLLMGAMPTASLSGNAQILMGPPSAYAVERHEIFGNVAALVNTATGYVQWCPVFEDETTGTILAGSVCQSGMATTGTGTRIAALNSTGALVILNETTGKINFCNAYFSLSSLPGKWTYSKCVTIGSMPTASLSGNAQIIVGGGVDSDSQTLLGQLITIVNSATGVWTLCPTFTKSGVIQAGTCSAAKAAP